jgi:hypothetical protein
MLTFDKPTKRNIIAKAVKRVRTTKRKSNLDIITTLPTTHARHRNP